MGSPIAERAASCDPWSWAVFGMVLRVAAVGARHFLFALCILLASSVEETGPRNLLKFVSNVFAAK